MSLQAQDIISQKAAHVAAALGVMREQFAAIEGEGHPSRVLPVLQSLDGAARVEASQVQAIRSDIATAKQGLITAAREVRGAVELLNQENLCMDGVDPVSAEAQGFVQVLLDTLHDLRDLVEEVIVGAEQAHTAIRPVGGQTSNLTATMRQLSAQIQLIGLYAQVQAARVGTGTGLERLAAETTRVATETAETSEAGPANWTRSSRDWTAWSTRSPG